jgi:hypothetical protein
MTTVTEAEEYSIEDSNLYFGMWKSVWRKKEGARVVPQDKEYPWMRRVRDERVPFSRVERREAEDVYRDMSIGLINYIKAEFAFQRGKAVKENTEATYNNAEKLIEPLVTLVMTPRPHLWTIAPGVGDNIKDAMEDFLFLVAVSAEQRFSVKPAIVYEETMGRFADNGRAFARLLGTLAPVFAKTLVPARAVDQSDAIRHFQRLNDAYSRSLRHLIDTLFLHGYVGNATSDATMRCIGAATEIGRALDDYGIGARKD